MLDKMVGWERGNLRCGIVKPGEVIVENRGNCNIDIGGGTGSVPNTGPLLSCFSEGNIVVEMVAGGSLR